MKILLVSYYGWLFGGGETYLFNLADELQAGGHDIRIFTSDNGYREHTLKTDYTFSIAHTRIGWAFCSLFNFQSLRALKKVLEDFDPDVVHINSLSNEVSPSVTWALKKYPTLLFVHSQYMFMTEKALPLTKKVYAYINVVAKKKIIRNVDLVLAPSSSLLKTIPTNQFFAKAVGLGIAPLSYSPLTRFERLIFIGRLAPDKGVDVLLEALGEVVKIRPTVHLDIIGSGSEETHLKELVTQLSLDHNVTFIGYVERLRAMSYVRRATVLVLPSVYEEPFGLSGLEALFVGRPVIASRIGGIPEWLNETCGKLVTPGDVDELSVAILNILSDKNKLIKMSKVAHNHAQPYSIQSHASKMKNIYQSLLD
jgi:glycosyltransferase involved in cell wall biosynthesis